jgi:tripartite-type tricarboxylate transporter receptor subunit TctC
MKNENWYGLLAPNGTPKPIIDKLHAAIAKALNDPEIKEQFYAQGSEPTVNTPLEFREFISDETERMAKIVKRAGIKVD